MVREHTSNDFDPFQFTEARFMVWRVGHPGEWSMDASEDHVFCCCWVESSLYVNQVKLFYSIIKVFIFLMIFFI